MNGIIMVSLAFGFTFQLAAMEADPKSDDAVFSKNLLAQLEEFVPVKASLVEKMNGVEDAMEEQIITFEEVSLENVERILTQATDMHIDDRLSLIKKAFIFSDISNNTLKRFTRLMDILVKKFTTLPRKTLAERFGTSIADHYIFACNEFITKISEPNYLNYAIESLNQSVDPNFSWFEEGSNATSSFLSKTYYDIFNHKDENRVAIFELLLHHGAKPDAMLKDRARKYANHYPTELNIRLSKLLEQAVENK